MLAVGFLVGMIPAMLLIGFFSGRQVEKQRNELKLQYERQVTALRATIRRLMQRIDLLTGERNKLKQSNKSLREAVRDQNRAADDVSSELERKRADMTHVQERMEQLEAENLRHEGRLEEAHRQQERMKAQFAQTVSQLTEAERMRRNLLFATNQLREAQVYNKALETRIGKQPPGPQDQDQNELSSPEQQDVAVIEGMEPIYVERLHDSGIYTIADLANQTPARVAHFAGLPSWEESAEWIAEAKVLMAQT